MEEAREQITQTTSPRARSLLEVLNAFRPLELTRKSRVATTCYLSVVLYMYNLRSHSRFICIFLRIIGDSHLNNGVDIEE